MTKKYRRRRRAKRSTVILPLGVEPVESLTPEVVVETIAPPIPPCRSFWDWLFRRR
jgi:hypothetical protein